MTTGAIVMNRVPWKTVFKVGAGFVVAFAVAAAAGAFLREPMQQLGAWAVGRFGLGGLFGAVLFIDSVPTPLSYAPFMLLSREGGLSLPVVFAVSAGASYLAGLWGFTLGRLIGMPRSLEQKITVRWPELLPLLERRGAWGVAAIAALPLPLALGTWSAGALRIKPAPVALALLIRFPKTGFYLLAIEGGLRATAG